MNRTLNLAQPADSTAHRTLINREWKIGGVMAAVFLVIYFLPLEHLHLNNPIGESLQLTRWYAREHVLLCLIPAFFIAGAIGVFVRQTSVMKYLGPNAGKITAYSVAAVSGSVLAVCSCTVLPLFAGIYAMGAGLGPAAAFLYAGPAINVLAMILTARVIGMPIGVARAVGAVIFAIVIGLIMHLIFRRDDGQRTKAAVVADAAADRPLWKTILFFAALVGILIFANWAPSEESAIWSRIHEFKWWITGTLLAALGVMVTTWFDTSERQEWVASTWGFTKQIAPLLLIGVLVSGLLLGRPGHEGLIPSAWVNSAVGGNSFGANALASVVGAFMYFATLTEVPIVQGLMGSGMGNGPALALLLAGPALSLPSMLVIRKVMGTRKAAVFIVLVVIMAAVSGLMFGSLVP